MIFMKSFGKLPDGRMTTLYTMTNASGASVSITNYGGIINAIMVPDRDGKLGDVALGYDSVEGYLPTNGYLGALIGRIGNRIGGGECMVAGEKLHLAKNDNGVNHLHGGNEGFNLKIWDTVPVIGEGEDSLVMSIVSPDGEEGYPGNLCVKVTYTFTDNNELKIHYEAETDKETIVNLTNHTYFNLNGEGGSKIINQKIQINASHMTPGDSGLIPTGELRPVEGTVFDLRKPTLIGESIDRKDDDQLVAGGGYDHNFCLDGEGMREAVVLSAEETGRVMKVYTDQPGVQFYAANMLMNTNIGKCGRGYSPRDGLCLETQNYPDAVNHPNFPSPALKPGEKYDTTTIYAFEA